MSNYINVEFLECEGQCGLTKPLSTFSKNQRKGDKWCIECVLWKESEEPAGQAGRTDNEEALSVDAEGEEHITPSNGPPGTFATPSTNLNNHLYGTVSPCLSNYVPPHLRGINGGRYGPPTAVSSAVTSQIEVATSSPRAPQVPTASPASVASRPLASGPNRSSEPRANEKWAKPAGTRNASTLTQGNAARHNRFNSDGW